MKKIFIAVALLLSSQAVMAELVWFGDGLDFDAYYIDDSVRKKGSKVKVWVVWDYSSAQAFDSGLEFMSMKNQQEYDCYGELSRTVYYTAVSGILGRGDIVSSANESSSGFNPVIPGTNDEKLFRELCIK